MKAAETAHEKTSRHEKYKVSERNNQLVLVANSEIFLPEDAPAWQTGAQLEKLNWRKLYKAYSSRGRIPVADPCVLLKAMVYGYQCGICSTCKLSIMKTQAQIGLGLGESELV